MPNKVWNEVELAFIKANANKVTDIVGARQLSKISGRRISVHSWRKQRQQMGIKKAHGRGICRVVEGINTQDSKQER